MENQKETNQNSLSMPASIIIGCLILGGFFYSIQTSKQKSIESQQKIQQELETEREELLSKQQECESLSKGVMKEWNNIIGVTYDKDFWEECVVTYTDTETGEIETSPLSSMKTVK